MLSPLVAGLFVYEECWWYLQHKPVLSMCCMLLSMCCMLLSMCCMLLSMCCMLLSMCCRLLSLCCMQCLQTWPDNSELSVQPWEETTQRRVNTRNKAESFYAHNYFQHTVKLIISVQAVQAVQAVLTWEKQNFKFSINIFNQWICSKNAPIEVRFN